MPQKQPPARIARSVDAVMSLLLVLTLEQLTVDAIALALELIQGNETQRGGIDAVAQAARLAWAIGEDMAEVAVPMTGANLGPNHPEAAVRVLDHILRLERPGEARPTGVAVGLVARGEQRFARHDVHVTSRLFAVPLGVFKGPLRPVMLRHTVLLGRKARYGFRILAVFRHIVTLVCLFHARHGTSFRGLRFPGASDEIRDCSRDASGLLHAAIDSYIWKMETT